MAPTAPEHSRRAFVAGAALLLPQGLRAAGFAGPVQAIRALEKPGMRIGVAALDTGSGNSVFHRETERFVMCSTFKFSLVAATLAKTAKGTEHLDRLIRYGADVPIGVSPATRKNVAKGMTVSGLCEAAILYSDNGAANLLLEALGGPAALTAFWRHIGDRTTRLDDNELKLNIPDGTDRNTTTTAAMMGNLKAILLGDVLSHAARDKLLGWMRTSTVGMNRLRAGFPAAWQWGDKTGTSAARYGLVHDIGIATPPGRKPILIACYTEQGDEKTLAAVGKVLAEAFA